MDLTPEQKAFMKEVFARQKEGYAFLERERIENIRKTDMIRGVQVLSGLAHAWTRLHGLASTSGLVQMYQVLAKGGK